MIETKLKLWRTVGAAALTAGALGLTACGESEKAADAPPAAETATSPAGEGGEGEGGEAGEAGIAGVFNGLEGEALTNARLQQLKGFVLIARHASEGNTGADGGVLVDQGLLEVYDAHTADFGGFDPAPVRAAGLAQLDGQSRQVVAQRLDAAKAAIAAAQAELDGDAADLARRMIDIAEGLYQHVNSPDGVDPMEYQHSLGAALAARDALVRGETALRTRNSARYDEVIAAVDAFIALWPTPAAPETPATMQQVAAQASRVKLLLSTL